MKNGKCYYNGKIVPVNEAKVSAGCDGFRQGRSVIETFACRNWKVVLFKEHLERMKRGMDTFGLKETGLDFAQVVKQVMKENGLKEARVRITVFRDEKGENGEKTGVIVCADEMPLAEITANGVECVTGKISWKREYDFKCGNFMEYVIEREKAEKKGAFDAILVRDGKVLEGCIANVFLVKNGELITPAVSQGIVSGIARKAVLIAAKKIGMKAVEREVNAEELLAADEVLLTNAVRGVVAVKKIDGKKIGSGETCTRLREQYEKMFEEI
ncbi:Amino-transferase class IV [Candidatus Gugararchaeum adminiculabundum]|nr:Amino-transferase class IV [Candidatus Gugararchaeum adminiculabundum]